MSEPSVIGRGTRLRGDVSGDGSLEVFGTVEGEVRMNGDVRIAEGALVVGNVSGVNVTVEGSVQGELRGSESVQLERGARVVGDLLAPRLGIGAGALVRGTVRTDGEPVPAAARHPAVPPAVATAAAAPARALASPFVAKTRPGRVEANKPDAKPARTAPLAEAARPEPPARRDPGARPPAPVLPSLGKGAKAKKKKARDT